MLNISKLFAAICLTVALFFVAGLHSLMAKNNKPNIIVILVDDLGYGDLSINGGKDIYTPHIDKLFEKGMKFTSFYANCTVCSPTRASLMTGCYPDIAGVPGVIRTHATNSWGYLREDLATLPGMLKKAG
jgi:arylsulfatase A-like enzyme